MKKGKDAKKLLERSIDFIKELSQKLQKEAGKSWSISNLRIEINALKKRRNERLKMMGERVYDLMRQSKMKETSLRMLFEEIAVLDEQLQEKETKVEKIAAARERMSASSRSGMQISRAKSVKNHATIVSKTVSSTKDHAAAPRAEDKD